MCKIVIVRSVGSVCCDFDDYLFLVLIPCTVTDISATWWYWTTLLIRHWASKL